MVEKTQIHFAWNEVKTSILELILASNGSISEPSIRDKLQEKYGAADQGLINKQLHALKSNGCIEKVTPVKKTRFNYWDIKKYKQLGNIHNHFPNISLNSYVKPLAVIFREFDLDLGTFDGFQFHILLFLQKSLFKTCLETDASALIFQAQEIYLERKGRERQKNISGLLGKCLDMYNSRNLDSAEIPMENFRRRMNEIASGNFEIMPNDLRLQIIMKKLPGLKEETLLKEIEKNFPGNPHEIDLGIPLGIHDNDLEKYIYGTIWFLLEEREDIKSFVGGFLLGHFFDHDRMLGIRSDEEIKFIEGLNEKSSKYADYWGPIADNSTRERLHFLGLASELLVEYQLPHFGKVFTDFRDAFRTLVEQYAPWVEVPTVEGNLRR
jgi:hypothetical protein